MVLLFGENSELLHRDKKIVDSTSYLFCNRCLDKTTIFLLLLVTSLFADVDIRISELMASHATIQPDTLTGEYPDWIELYNAGDPVQLSDIYLSDSENEPTKWRSALKGTFETGEYALFWADGLNSGNHTSFKLSSTGEFLGVSVGTNEFVDSITFDLQIRDVSYGRNQDGEKVYFSIPTPGSVNSSLTVYTPDFQIAVPEFSQSGGNYSTGISLELTAPAGGDIFYTLDGSVPDVDDLHYSGPLFVDSVTIVRARVFRDGYLPSTVVTNTYFIGLSHSLPLISVVTDSVNLWDDYTGIYTIGKNGKHMYGLEANYIQRWERFANFELYDSPWNGDLLNLPCGLSIAGERRHMLQKSMKVNFKSKYGAEFAEGTVFPFKNTKIFHSFFIRNSGFPDYQYTMFKDGFLHTLVGRNMDVDWMGYKPAVLYFNGQYWGLYNLREKLDEDHLASTYGIDPNKIDIVEFFDQTIYGDSSTNTGLMDFMYSCDPQADSSYDYFISTFDIESFFDYNIAEVFVSNMDWPWNNNRRWRLREENEKWRWFFLDVDVALGNWNGVEFNTLAHALAENSDAWWNPPSSTLIFRKIMGHETLRNRFIQKFAAHLHATFDTTDVLTLLDSMQSVIEPEMPAHIQRWQDCDPNEIAGGEGCVVSSMEDWHFQVEKMRNFLRERSAFVYEHINAQFNLEGTVNLSFSTNGDHGRVLLNNVDLDEKITNCPIFKNIPFAVKIIPNPGWRYSVENLNFNSGDSAIALCNSDTTFTIVYTPDTVTILPDTIASDMELTKNKSPYIVVNDLHISEGAEVTIAAGVEILMGSESDIAVEGVITAVGAEDDSIYIVPNYRSGSTSWNGMKFLNPTAVSKLEYVVLKDGASQKNNQVKATLEAENGSFELRHSFVSGEIQPVFTRNSVVLFSNSEFFCNSTCDFINAKGGYPVIDSCVFNGNQAIDTDAIDYDGVDSGKILNSTISNFTGSNSDGIDLGEGAQNILVENNRILNCSDKGISIGQAATATINNNLLYQCNMGVGIKDSSSFGKIVNTTFIETEYGVACFEKNPGRGGGKAEVVNTLFSDVEFACSADTFSEVSVSYSLFHSGYALGVGNIQAVPIFQNPEELNYNLALYSPGIDAGSPDLPRDPDGTRSDIGAQFLSMYDGSTSGSVKIAKNFVFMPDESSVLNLNFVLRRQEKQDVTIRIMDIRGRILKKVDLKQLPSGIYTHSLDMKTLASGFYICQMYSRDFNEVFKIPFMK